TCLEEGRDHDALSRVFDLGCEARPVCRPCRHHLGRAADVMEREVGAEAYHMRADVVGHLPALVGQTALQTLGRNRTVPARQRAQATQAHAATSSPSRCRAARAEAPISLSAMMAMNATASPATR